MSLLQEPKANAANTQKIFVKYKIKARYFLIMTIYQIKRCKYPEFAAQAFG